MSLSAALLPLAFIATFAALLLAVERVSIEEDKAGERPLTLIAFAP